jgi:hypothetical protein
MQNYDLIEGFGSYRQHGSILRAFTPIPVVIIGEHKANINLQNEGFLCSSFRLCCGRSEGSAAATHALTELLAFLRRHVFPSLDHAAAPVQVPARVAPESTEEDFAKSQNPDSLPEVDRMPAKKTRHKPVPQRPHHKAKHSDQQRGE